MYYVPDKSLFIHVVASTNLIGLTICLICGFFAQILILKNKDSPRIVSISKIIIFLSSIGCIISIVSLNYLY